MREYFTVSELNNYIDSRLKNDPVLIDCWIKGEISGCKVYQQSGHMYFNLKDRDSVISSVMFKSRTLRLRFVPRDGVEVLARGNVALFAKQGKYQFYAQEMQLYGVGDLYWQLEQLKEKLQAQGYFALEHKKPLPPMVKRLGIVSSQDGAALRDVLKVVRSRAGSMDIIIAHSAVQGAGAPEEIAAAISRLNKLGGIDVIIVARGGGSLEDLMAFNSETVVKAVYDSSLPVISGVGHEVDTTLIDLAADIRAATPTQAAQIAVPDRTLLMETVLRNRQLLIQSIQRQLLQRNELLDRLMMQKVWQQPESWLKNKRLRVSDLQNRLHNNMKHYYKDKAAHFALVAKGLDSLSPLKVMGRGYAIIERQGKILRDAGGLEKGEVVAINLRRHRLLAQILEKEQRTYGDQI